MKMTITNILKYKTYILKKMNGMTCFFGGKIRTEEKEKEGNKFKNENRKRVWLHNGMANGKMFVRQMMSCNKCNCA